MHQGFDPSPYLHPISPAFVHNDEVHTKPISPTNISTTSTSSMRTLTNHVSTSSKSVTIGTSSPKQSSVPTVPKQTLVKKTIKTSSTISAPTPLYVGTSSSSTIKGETTATTEVTDPLSSGALNQKDIFNIVNIERVKMGLLPLAFSVRLSAMAEGKAVDMINKQYFAHVSPSGVDIAQLSKVYGYEYIFLGENLALGDFTSSSEVMTRWMNSPGHRANILSSNFTEIGISALLGNYEGRSVWYAVQEFGRPISSCPIPDSAFEATIAVEEQNVTTLLQTLTTMRAQMEQSKDDQAVYNIQAENYNNMIDTYNALVTKTKSDIALYNASVSAFNICVGSDTSTSTSHSVTH